MSEPGPGWPGRPTRRLLGVVGLALLMLNAAALSGFLLRDRSAWLAPLMYLPLAPLGLAAAGLDLARRGGGVGRPRFLLTAVGLAALGCSCAEMIGRGPTVPAYASDGEPIRLLHWNVLWGGHPRTDATWTSIEDDIIRRAPDIVVLSEAPPDARIDSLRRRLGPEWTSTQWEHPPRSSYWYKLVALSRWPVREGRPVAIRNGAALDVRVERPDGPLRLLIVDGQSRPTQLRTPMLEAVAAACRRAAAEGEPYDALVGDFNAVARALGFDAIRSAAGGYEAASRSSAGWRGTWPMPLPLYDIDHVWIRADHPVLGCALFANMASDHRGQLVRFSASRSAGSREESTDGPGPGAGSR
ncbi:endonuclease/exonuclease/phosphatase family protein [Paludisphaera sp.]|uniref:endonuclease/exonuclease/phosphatase family protein n=1 Tax=Paludisphaera sp. TaxID=2017432 RepID=UPI00301C7B54